MVCPMRRSDHRLRPWCDACGLLRVGIAVSIGLVAVAAGVGTAADTGEGPPLTVAAVRRTG